MAEKIKSISKFSEDAINLAVNDLPRGERKQINSSLDGILSRLGKKERKQAIEKKTSDEVVFANAILPQIKGKLDEVEAKDLQKFTIAVDFKVKTTFTDLNEAEMYTEHSRLVLMETGVNNLIIIVQFCRGKFYLDFARHLNKTGRSLLQVIKRGEMTGISYKTALRYMALASIISQYPRLLLCELSFSQIIKHKSRLRNFLRGTEGQHIGDRLSLPIDLIAQGNDLSIGQVDMDEPKISFNTGPDWMHHDRSASDVPTDDAVKRWVESAHEVDETEDLEGFMITDVTTFTAMVERLGDGQNLVAPAAIHKQLGFQHKLPVPEIQDLFQAVKDATGSSKKPEYAPLDDSDTLFPKYVVRRWRRDKTKLKRVIDSHEAILELMIPSQQKCWVSRSKATTCGLMLDTATAALAYCEPNTAEYRAREKAINGLQQDLDKRQAAHKRDVYDYEGLMLRELGVRGKIHKIALSLESDMRAQTRDIIVDRLTAKSTTSMRMTEICRRLFDMTSYKYRYSTPPPNVSGAAFNTPVAASHIEGSAVQLYSPGSTYAPPNTSVTITTPSPVPSVGPDTISPSDQTTKQDTKSKTQRNKSGWRRMFKFWGGHKESIPKVDVAV